MSIGKIRKAWLGKALDAMTAERDKWFMAAASEEQRADQQTMERDEIMRRLDAIRELHAPVMVEYFDGDTMQACKTCGAHFEYPVAYPCTTARVARGDFA